jgi:hypothetical protein
VTIEQAALARLEVRVTGAGEVTVGGRAQEAQVALTGTGLVRIDEVAARPGVRVVGSGAVEIGNW